MIMEGAFVDNILMHSETRPYPVEPQETSGEILGSDSIYKYGLKESSYPTLTIVDTISDHNGNTIPSGHYELAISDDKKFLILMQSKQPLAILPVFKVEIEISEKEQIQTFRELRKKVKKEKEIAKTNAKRQRKGMTLITPEDDIYMEATIEYNPAGKYYLIKYEREDVRAWSAIKE